MTAVAKSNPHRVVGFLVAVHSIIPGDCVAAFKAVGQFTEGIGRGGRVNSGSVLCNLIVLKHDEH